MTLPNPLLPGFNPDPSIVLADGAYYLITSSFEYLPGLPVHRSTDLVDWVRIGNVATRPDQVQVGQVPTGGGVYAPTIRYREGTFYVIVTVAFSPVGCVLFTATDPAGPWSDGVGLEVEGIDPDLAWDDEGTALVTYSAHGDPAGIAQVAVDLDTGCALEAPRRLWSGTGLKAPEAPHLHRRGPWWHLLIAEGGTERGHAVSVARGASPRGPFQGHPANPVLSARSTDRAVQNTGHGDLVDTPDGRTVMVLLGMRPVGLTRAFSPLGRETFVTAVDWVDDWPQPAPVQSAPRPGGTEFAADLTDPGALVEPGWLAVRTLPADVATVAGGRLVVRGTGRTLADPHPAWLGRRQEHLTSSTSTRVDVSAGAGGLAMRYGQTHWVALHAETDGDAVVVTAQARAAGLAQDWSVRLPAGEVGLRIETEPPPTGFTVEALGGDRVRLLADGGDGEVLLAELDGRHWTAESATSFAGRVTGPYATTGSVSFRDLRWSGTGA